MTRRRSETGRKRATRSSASAFVDPQPATPESMSIAIDVLPAIRTGEYELAVGLLWPLLPLTVRPEPGSFTEHVLGIEPTPYFLFQIALTIVAGVVWYRDGMPGFSLVRDGPRYLLSRLSQSHR